MTRKKLSIVTIASIVLTLLLVALPFMSACAKPAPAPAPAPAPTPAPAPAPAPAPPPEPALPELIGVSTTRIGAAGHIMAGTLGEVLKKETGMKIRVVPIGSDTARMGLLRSRSVEFAIQGSVVYSMRTGIGNFATYEWGPQLVQIVWRGPACCAPVTTQAHKDINTIADIKGKRVAWIPDASSQMFPTAVLAFAGLTQDDIVKVPVAGYMAQFEALLAGQVDIAPIGNVATGKLYEIEASPKGLKWLPIPREDKEGWKRLNSITPWEVPFIITSGPGISEENPVEVGGHFYGFVTYDWASPDLVYLVTKTIAENLEDLKAATESWRVYNLDLAFDNTNELHIYHEGAIRYFREKGLWTADHEKRNQRIIEQQAKLMDAWDSTLDKAIAEEWKDAELKAEWQKIQAAITGFTPPEWY